MPGSYRDLVVWQKSIGLSLLVYELTDNFPSEEKYGLSAQMRRSAVSIASNIAEGKMRGYNKEFRKFLLIAYGSAAELDTQITIAKQLTSTSSCDYTGIEPLLEEILKMLNRLIGQVGSANG